MYEKREKKKLNPPKESTRYVYIKQTGVLQQLNNIWS